MKVDLHVHSKFSTRPSQWVLHKFGCQESYTEPAELYRLAQQRGMDWVTISDHNTIDGGLEIAHLPQVFLSEEVTAYFPEDGCKIHVLVYDLNEKQHQEIQQLRYHIYDLLGYLHQEDLTHALAHPLWAVNDRLTVNHFEKLLLLFQNFELNGGREAQLNDWLQVILSLLTPQLIGTLKEKHHLVPVAASPWQKNLVGGSDDHSGLYIARMYTEVAGATTLPEFFQGIKQNQARVQGQASSPQTLAHNIFSIGYQFYKQSYDLGRYANHHIFIKLLEEQLGGAAPKPPKWFSVSKLFPFANNASYAKKSLQDLTFLDIITREVCKLADQISSPQTTNLARPSPLNGADQGWFQVVNTIGNNVLSHFHNRLQQGLEKSNLCDIFQSLCSGAAVYFLLTPYYAAYSSFTKDRSLGQKIMERLGGISKYHTAPETFKLALFTDTFYEVNGVALTLRQRLELALKDNLAYKVITCDHLKRLQPEGVKNFTPLGVFDLPEYQEMKLFHPPFLEMLQYCYQENFTHLHAATPGPLGLAALAIARILNLPLHGTYHTALPQYADYLTNDQTIVDLVWQYIIWFYNQMDIIYVPSQSCQVELIHKGIRAEKIRLFPRGVDITRFNPAKANGYLKKHHQVQDGPKLLYVGRVSKEKNLPLLCSAFKSLLMTNPQVTLIVVGDGPYFKEMQETMKDTPCIFTGYLDGEDLAAVYASCDLFLFPSTTDTFGNVVLEAQASGIPVIVSDCGGPKENIIPGETGLVVPGNDVEGWRRAIQTLLADPVRRRKMGRAARQYVESRSFEEAFRQTWQMYHHDPELN